MAARDSSPAPPKTAGKYTLTLNAYNVAGKGSTTLTLTVEVGAAGHHERHDGHGYRRAKAFSYQIAASGSPDELTACKGCRPG